MKGDQFLEEMERIDPELIKESEGYRAGRSRRKKTLAVILSAAAVLLLVGTGVGIGVSQRIRREGGKETAEESAKTEPAAPTSERAERQEYAEAETAGSERWETRTATAAETEAGTTTETWREKTWEEKSISERFREFEYQGAWYSVRASVGADRIGEKLADVTLLGQDTYTGKTYEASGEVLRLRGVTEKAAVVLRFTEGGEAFAAMSPDYRPASLQAFLEEADMKDLMSFPGTATYQYFDAENRSHTVTFEGVSREWVLGWLQKYAAAEAVDFDTFMSLPEQSVSYMSCSVSAADFSRENVTMSFTKSGYLWTNLFDAGLSFHVGEEAVQEFEQYLKADLTGYELVPASDPGTAATGAETTEGVIETGMETVIEYSTSGKDTGDPVPEPAGTEAAETDAEDPYAAWSDGIYLRTAEGCEPMIYLPSTGPCGMYGLTDEMKAVLAPLKTGDVISIRFSFVQETYPGNVYPKDVAFVREGEESEIPEGEIRHLQAMGWRVIDSDHPLGIPNYEFTLSWGAYGNHSYDSETGKLVKMKEATHPEDYETVHLLTEDERVRCWQYLMNSNYTAFPEGFDPDKNVASEPPSAISLSVTCEGETKKVSCSDSAYFIETAEPGVPEFFENIGEITQLLMETEEFRALPDYEFYYE